MDQGWTQSDQDVFYNTSQGSRLIPAAWFAALRRIDKDEEFGQDHLARFGYLPSGAAALPIGFVVDPASGDLGMTCAACHTGAIQYKGHIWRIDGGRANADFQRFLTELAQTAQDTLKPDRFAAFAQKIAGPDASEATKDALKARVSTWTDGFTTFMDHSLPHQAWGPGRLDAFGMIFNRVTALDLGIPGNYSPANAPVRYPFLWNAPFQDRTQWDGAAPNGNYVKGLARNTGEVFGVFGRFQPRRIGLLIDYDNSIAFRNLHTLERKVAALKPPPWPQAEFGLDKTLLPRGSVVFNETCASCHAKQPSSSVQRSWATPVCRVETDPLMFSNAKATADAGLLAGSFQLSSGGVLQQQDQKLAILANAVIGSMVRNVGIGNGLARALNQDFLDRLDPAQPGIVGPGPRWTLPEECAAAPPRPVTPLKASTTSAAGTRAVVAKETNGLYELPPGRAGDVPVDAAYEARVLNGIWATAPYLHNGSVPTLRQLLMPARDRVSSFPTGLREFDPADVGVAAAPPSPDNYDVHAPGNSNSGHEYGTSLPEADRRALLEYLKVL